MDLERSIRTPPFVEGAIKTADDLARYRRIIEQTRPDVIVETGTYAGGSACWFAQFAPVITVDIAPATIPDHPWVTSVIGSSTDPDVIAAVHAIVAGRSAMVTLDSDHGRAHVLAEMEAYHDLVPVGGYMVVEDSIVRWIPSHPHDGTPYDAIDEWLPAHPGWANDILLEDAYATTQHPGGWLRRDR